MADLANNMNIDVLKVPLGFIRILEFPLVIISFAAACNFHYKAEFTFPTTKNATDCQGATGSFSFGYPYSLTHSTVESQKCIAANGKALFGYDYTSQAQFFVFTGVISFLYILAILALYLFKWPIYENDRRAPLVDCAVTGVLSLFWFAGTCAWAAAVTPIRYHTKTNLETLLNDNVPQCAKGCVISGNGPTYGGIIISAIAGFGCVIAFAGNLWFVYKETEWFKSRQGPPPVGNLPGETLPSDFPPPAAAPGAGPYNPN